MFFIFPKFRSEILLILKIGYLSDYNSKLPDFADFDFDFKKTFSLSQVIRVSKKTRKWFSKISKEKTRWVIKFRVHLTLQFNV